MNWTSSFLVQGDKLVIVLHLLLAPVGTVRSCSSSKTALVVGQRFDTILNFSEVHVLLVINDLVIDDPVGLITCGRK